MAAASLVQVTRQVDEGNQQVTRQVEEERDEKDDRCCNQQIFPPISHCWIPLYDTHHHCVYFTNKNTDTKNTFVVCCIQLKRQSISVIISALLSTVQATHTKPPIGSDVQSASGGDFSRGKCQGVFRGWRFVRGNFPRE